jgi:two-component system sensor histidine kinase YesM
MAGEINKLFNECFKMQIAQKTAEFQALQAQINPHFLYNTLQTVQYMAVKRHAYEVYSIISALGDILKYCVRNKENIVALSEEFAYVDKFLLIQRFKYVNNLDVHLNFDDEVKSVKVSKMILQPLIENCFGHGFESNITKFRIEVDCIKIGESVLINISDNGKGIEADKLKELQDDLNRDEEIVNFNGDEVGIMNVNTRLKILYKDKYAMSISSIPFEKTTISIKIPFSAEGIEVK